MRPRGEARQVSPVRINELVAVDVLGKRGDRSHTQLDAPLSARIAADAKPKTDARRIDTLLLISPTLLLCVLRDASLRDAPQDDEDLFMVSNSYRHPEEAAQRLSRR